MGDATGKDATGIDATGIDATGIDATGIDATGIDATGIDATGIDATADASFVRLDGFNAILVWKVDVWKVEGNAVGIYAAAGGALRASFEFDDDDDGACV
jgi:hypothetical protein